MSAIFGIFHRDGEPVSLRDLERMDAALEAHGPDGGGFWTEGSVGLGRRLMRLTPEDRFEGRPSAYASGKRVLVFAGRMDNREELKSLLSIPPAEARSLPDSEFARRAHDRWGRDGFRRLIGCYALALWDAGENELLLARSPVNAPPLFYHVTPRSFAFATMPKGLFALPGVSREIHEQVVADYLTMTPLDEPDACFYRGVRRMQAGHWLAAGREGVETRRFWRVDSGRTIRYPLDEDYVEAFDDLFSRVVKSQLRASGPVGVMMSGGLDSSSVAAVAAPLLEEEGKDLAAFTEVPRPGFDGPLVRGRYADETPYVQAIARMHGNLRSHLVRTDGRMYLEDLDSFFAAAEVPFRNASNRVYIEAIQHEARQRGIGVLLSGGQGNLTISWAGDGLLPDLLRRGRWLRALREARLLARRGYSRSMWRTLGGKGVGPFLPGPLWGLVEALRGNRKSFARNEPPWRAWSPVHPSFAEEHEVEARARAKDHAFHFKPSPDTRAVRLDVLQGFGLFDGLGAGYQAMFRTEGRDPTTDVRVIEFCLGIPEEQYLRDGVPKRLIRRTMAQRLPPEVLWNKKRGLQAADWLERLQGARERILLELTDLEGSSLASRALDLPRLRRLVEGMDRAGNDAGELMRQYRGVLELGLMTACFLRWVEKESIST